MIIRLIVGSIKKTLRISEYFAKPKCLGGNVKVELDLSSYPTKEDLKMQQMMINRILLKRLI